MADQIEAGGGEAAAAPTGAGAADAPAAPARLRPSDIAARDRAAFIAGEEAAEEAEAAEAVAPKAKPKAKGVTPPADEDDVDAEPEPETEDTPADEDDAPPADDDAAEEEVEDDAADAAAIAAKGKTDPELAKRLQQVRKTEQRGREALARDRAAFERDRAAWQADVKEVAAAAKRLEKLKARVKYEPEAVLAELGLSEDAEFDLAARRAYARTKAGSADPKSKDAVDRMTRDREAGDRLAQLEKKNAEIEQRFADQAAEREAAEYMGGVYKTIPSTAAAPLTQRQHAKNPKKVEQALAAVALELSQKSNQLPTAKAVIATYEKRRRAELEDAGVDIDALIKSPLPAKAATPKPGDKTTATKAAPAKGATPTKTPSRADVVRELESGELVS